MITSMKENYISALGRCLFRKTDLKKSKSSLMDNQIKEIASIINNYNKKTEIKLMDIVHLIYLLVTKNVYYLHKI